MLPLCYDAPLTKQRRFYAGHCVLSGSLTLSQIILPFKGSLICFLLFLIPGLLIDFINILNKWKETSLYFPNFSKTIFRWRILTPWNSIIDVLNCRNVPSKKDLSFFQLHWITQNSKPPALLPIWQQKQAMIAFRENSHQQHTICVFFTYTGCS